MTASPTMETAMTAASSDLRAVRGRIFEIQRFSIHDGPGIRTTVFLKGCPLNCAWCHNPESISSRPLISFLPDKCIGCGYCLKTCPHDAHRLENGARIFDRDRCTACGACTKECYAQALELVGKEITAGEALAEVERDRPFYETSSGGLTLSGGEPTLQPEFSRALLTLAGEAGLHRAMETCGFCQWANLEQFLPLVELFLFDYKESDPAKHEEFTGVPRARIVENLGRLHAAGAQVLLRCPIVPGFNDRDDHFAGIAALTRELPGLLGAEIMPYHRLGESKLSRFGLDDSRRPHVTAPEPETVAAWRARLRELGARLVGEE